MFSMQECAKLLAMASAASASVTAVIVVIVRLFWRRGKSLQEP